MLTQTYIFFPLFDASNICRFYSDTQLNDNFKLPKCNSVHYVRENRSGDGVSLFISDVYEFRIGNDLSLKSDGAEVESAFVELSGECYCWCYLSPT